MLQGRLDNTTYQIGRTHIFYQFHALRPSKDEQITQYFTILMDLCKNPIGFHETISDKTMKIHLFCTMAEEFEEIIKKRTQKIPVPAARQVVPLLWDHTDCNELTKEIRDKSTRCALYNQHRRGYGICGGRGNFGVNCHWENNNIEYSSMHSKINNHTTERYGIPKWLNSRRGRFNWKMIEEVLCVHCGKAGHMRAECHSCQRSLKAQDKVNKRSRTDSMADTNMALALCGVLAGNRDLMWLSNTTHTTHTTAARTPSSTTSLTWVVIWQHVQW